MYLCVYVCRRLMIPGKLLLFHAFISFRSMFCVFHVQRREHMLDSHLAVVLIFQRNTLHVSSRFLSDHTCLNRSRQLILSNSGAES